MSKELTLTPNKQLSISEAQYQILTQATEADEVRYRRGKGGRQFPYTDTAYVIRTLNLAFGWDWDFEADNEEIFYVNSKPFETKVRGRLTVRNAGNEIIKTQFGCQPIEYLKDSDTPISLGDAYKGAASDALKKCASLLGVALDLYDSDSDISTGKVSQTKPTVEVKKPSMWLPTKVEFFATVRDEFSISVDDAAAILKEYPAFTPFDSEKATDMHQVIGRESRIRKEAARVKVHAEKTNGAPQPA